MGRIANYADVWAMKAKIGNAIMYGAGKYLRTSGWPYAKKGHPAISIWVDYNGDFDAVKNEFAAHSFKAAVQWAGFDGIEVTARFPLVRDWIKQYGGDSCARVCTMFHPVDSSQHMDHVLDGESSTFNNQKPVLMRPSDPIK